MKYYAALSKDEQNLKASSSGGVFFELCKKIISENGIVYGVEQSTVIDGVTYCHIVDAYTGNATPVNDAVVVITENGLFGDALSTTMMLCTLEEIKKLESLIYMKILVINKGQITYQSKGLEVLYH